MKAEQLELQKEKEAARRSVKKRKRPKVASCWIN
jgi:hypothetical protein